MNASRFFASTILLLVIPLYGNAEAVSLEEFCIEELGSWDAANSTCTTDGIVLAPIEQFVHIRRHESLHLLGHTNILGIFFNAGSLILGGDAIDTWIHSLVNTGMFVITEGTAAVFGDLARNPVVNSGVVESAGDLFVLSPMENQGHIENAGRILIDPEIVLENLGHINNGDGTLINHGRINNYRCPGGAGVVTAGAGNIENNGEIHYITGRDC